MDAVHQPLHTPSKDNRVSKQDTDPDPDKAGNVTMDVHGDERLVTVSQKGLISDGDLHLQDT